MVTYNQRARAGAARIHGFMTDAAGCEPHRPSSRHWRRQLVQVEATAVRPLGGRTRLVIVNVYIDIDGDG